MDATPTTAENSRYTLMLEWLKSLAIADDLQFSTITPASSDASFRHYYRLRKGDDTLIVMDAPPSKENNAAFADITARLAAVKLNVPVIVASNLELGFMLLSDLGKTNYYNAIQAGLEDAELQALYRNAIDSLVTLQGADHQGLEVYDAERMLDELSLFELWYVNQHCNTTLSEQERSSLAQCFAVLVADNVSVAQVLVHRDFHSPNLMMPIDSSLKPGIIDYQDAVAGPITYDLASMVMDARHTWSEEQQLDWAIRYWQAAIHAKLPVSTDFAEFHRAYEWMSVQRNLRILGVFSRLSIRDNKDQYLAHIPRVCAYLRLIVSRYEELSPIRKLLDRLEGRQTVLGVTL
ncbi:phosphotransferase [Paenalcaligenes niemegkensis]|uniref:aminoglycoside phosphotransferase family protein n=1 Tax=Paenalcaligenes niemegkensis TaxID=2895469 RepID=UPI001EE96786|nr:phosphotransferase [Paenalcaligenes niemegkensis]